MGHKDQVRGRVEGSTTGRPGAPLRERRKCRDGSGKRDASRKRCPECRGAGLAGESRQRRPKAAARPRRRYEVARSALASQRALPSPLDQTLSTSACREGDGTYALREGEVEIGTKRGRPRGSSGPEGHGSDAGGAPRRPRRRERGRVCGRARGCIRTTCGQRPQPSRAR